MIKGFYTYCEPDNTYYRIADIFVIRFILWIYQFIILLLYFKYYYIIIIIIIIDQSRKKPNLPRFERQFVGTDKLSVTDLR